MHLFSQNQAAPKCPLRYPPKHHLLETIRFKSRYIGECWAMAKHVEPLGKARSSIIAAAPCHRRHLPAGAACPPRFGRSADRHQAENYVAQTSLPPSSQRPSRYMVFAWALGLEAIINNNDCFLLGDMCVL